MSSCVGSGNGTKASVPPLSVPPGPGAPSAGARNAAHPEPAQPRRRRRMHPQPGGPLSRLLDAGWRAFKPARPPGRDRQRRRDLAAWRSDSLGPTLHTGRQLSVLPAIETRCAELQLSDASRLSRRCATRTGIRCRHAASFSPDGKQFAFRRGVPQKSLGTIVWRDLESGEERTLATLQRPKACNGGPAWSPDGKLIVTSEIEQGASGIVTTLVVHRIEDGRREVLRRRPGRRRRTHLFQRSP